MPFCSRDNMHVPEIPKDLSRYGSLNLTHAHSPEHHKHGILHRNRTWWKSVDALEEFEVHISCRFICDFDYMFHNEVEHRCYSRGRIQKAYMDITVLALEVNKFLRSRINVRAHSVRTLQQFPKYLLEILPSGQETLGTG